MSINKLDIISTSNKAHYQNRKEQSTSKRWSGSETMSEEEKVKGVAEAGFTPQLETEKSSGNRMNFSETSNHLEEESEEKKVYTVAEKNLISQKMGKENFSNASTSTTYLKIKQEKENAQNRSPIKRSNALTIHPSPSKVKPTLSSEDSFPQEEDLPIYQKTEPEKSSCKRTNNSITTSSTYLKEEKENAQNRSPIRRVNARILNPSPTKAKPLPSSEGSYSEEEMTIYQKMEKEKSSRSRTNSPISTTYLEERKKISFSWDNAHILKPSSSNTKPSLSSEESYSEEGAGFALEKKEAKTVVSMNAKSQDKDTPVVLPTSRLKGVTGKDRFNPSLCKNFMKIRSLILLAKLEIEKDQNFIITHASLVTELIQSIANLSMNSTGLPLETVLKNCLFVTRFASKIESLLAKAEDAISTAKETKKKKIDTKEAAFDQLEVAYKTIQQLVFACSPKRIKLQNEDKLDKENFDTKEQLLPLKVNFLEQEFYNFKNLDDAKNALDKLKELYKSKIIRHNVDVYNKIYMTLVALAELQGFISFLSDDQEEPYRDKMSQLTPLFLQSKQKISNKIRSLKMDNMSDDQIVDFFKHEIEKKKESEYQASLFYFKAYDMQDTQNRKRCLSLSCLWLERFFQEKTGEFFDAEKISETATTSMHSCAFSDFANYEVEFLKKVERMIRSYTM